MYVEPSTDVYILKNCPLESSYEHTVIFESKEAQENYFLSLAEYHPTAGDQHHKATYQRVNLNALKIELPVEKLYNCNYMMFKNEYFENKWFYAFITSVEYVNNRTSLINYYIDVIQTWFFEAELKPCFVEREHVIDDRIGANTVPEQLDLGDSMIYHYMDKAKYFSWVNGEDGGEMGDYYIEIVTAFDENGNKNAREAGLYGGVYSGLNYIYFESEALATEYINALVSNSGEDAVIGVYMIPKVITTKKDAPLSKHTWIADVSYASKWKYAWENEIKAPKNNKLYTYPFTAIICNNMVGSTIEYKVEDLCWEATDGRDEDGEIIWVDKEKYLDTKKEKFYYTIEGMSGAPPKCLMMPSHYAGQENARNQQLTIDNFPQCAFITDSYRAWVAMNYRSMNMAGISTILGAVGGSIADLGMRRPFGIIPNVIGAGTTIAEMYAEREKAKILPNKEHGMTAPDLAMGNDSLGFRFYCAHIRPEIAKRIDDYFERYGYQVNVNKVPNRNGRAHWNYVKTADCTLVGDVPDDDKQKIIAVYNRGITFWNHPEEVGDYTLDNNDGVLKDATQEPEWEEDPPFEEDTSIPTKGGIIFHNDVVTEEDSIDNAYAIYKYLKNESPNEWTNNAIIGLIANIDLYSNIDPARDKEPNKHGFLLWSGSRKTNLFEFLDANNYGQNDGLGQLRYIDEMTIANLEWLVTREHSDPVDFDTWRHEPSWGSARDSALAFYHNYMGGGSSNIEKKLKDLADYWKDKLTSYGEYDKDSSDGNDAETKTKPNSGTGSSSNNVSTINPKWYMAPLNGHMLPEYMRKNAINIYKILRAQGWSKKAIYAVLGNFEVTSELNGAHYVKAGTFYVHGEPLGFANWANESLEALTRYLIKYQYIHWPDADDDIQAWYNGLPEAARTFIGVERLDITAPLKYVYPTLLEVLGFKEHGDYEKGMIMYLNDKGGSSLEWKKTKGHNMSFATFRKNTTETVKTLTEVFNYNYMRGEHSSADTKARYDAAKEWKEFFETAKMS